jgi:hypothetical protein
MVVHKAVKSAVSRMHIKIQPPPVLHVIIYTAETADSNVPKLYHTLQLINCYITINMNWFYIITYYS